MSPGTTKMASLAFESKTFSFAEAKTEHNFQGKGYLNFECLTFIPIQTKLMDLTIMSEDEIAWVNKYHEQVWEKISPRVQKAEVKEWLRKATAKISRD